MPKKLFLILLSTVLVFSAVYFWVNFEQIKETLAGEEHNVFGWAWSETIGWISFNSIDGAGSINYGVNIKDDGVFEGYAWSENIGWITFNESQLSGCPASPCRTQVDIGTGQVSGWARALAFGDGWSGWIKMRCTGAECASSDYGVYIDIAPGSPTRGEFFDWAWGSDVVGWISFNCLNQGVCQQSDYKVRTTFFENQPPTAKNLKVWTRYPDEHDYCSAGLRYRFTWDFVDPDLPDDEQSAYQIQVTETGDPDFNSPVYDSGKVNSASREHRVPGGRLEYNKTYYWRLMVWDLEDQASRDWIYPPSPSGDSPTPKPGAPFETPVHAYPDVDFEWRPDKPPVGVTVYFTDQSTCFDVNPSGAPCRSDINSFFWLFQHGNPSNSTLQNATTTFTDIEPGGNEVSLTVTDSTGFACTKEDRIGVQLPLPEWREREPF